MRRYALHFLLVFNVACVAALAWLWLTPSGELRNTHWQRPDARKADFATMLPALPGFASADTTRFLAMLERPIFAITRRPPPPPPPPVPTAAEAPVDNLSTARLLGAFESADSSGIILNIGGKNRRARVNEAVDGWTVKSIEGRNVTFARDGQIRVLQLQRAVVSGAPGAGAPQGTGEAAPATPAGTPQPPRRGSFSFRR